MRNRVLASVVAAVFLAGPLAFAGERGMVSASGVEVKADPSPKGKKVNKLKQGNMVDVTDHSADGKWLKIAFKGPDGEISGWVDKTLIRSLSRYGFSWERKNAKGNGGTSTAATTTVPVETEAVPSGEGWGNENPPTEATPAPAGDGWGEATPAAEATPEGSGDGWESTGDATPAPAATPAEDEGWGDETDLTK